MTTQLRCRGTIRFSVVWARWIACRPLRRVSGYRVLAESVLAMVGTCVAVFSQFLWRAPCCGTLCLVFDDGTYFVCRLGVASPVAIDVATYVLGPSGLFDVVYPISWVECWSNWDCGRPCPRGMFLGVVPGGGWIWIFEMCQVVYEGCPVRVPFVQFRLPNVFVRLPVC